MSFFSKLGKELDGLFDGDKDKKKDKEGKEGKEDKESKADKVNEPKHDDAQRAMNPSQQYGAPPYGHSNTSSQPPTPSYGYPPHQQHTVFPPADQHQQSQGYPGQQQPAYGQDVSRGYPTHGATIPATPQVPQGWIPLFEPTSQRWAFLDQNSGKVEWNFPTVASYSVAAHDQTRGFDDQHGAQSHGHYGGGGHDQYGGGSHGRHDQYGGGHYDDGHGGEKKDKNVKEKKKDNSGMMLGAAAGVGAGVVGGVLLANALDDDDDHSQGGYYPPPPPPPPEVHEDSDHSSSSSSSDDEEQQEEYDD